MDYWKLPRLYVECVLETGVEITLAAAHAHYLKNVLRRKPGDSFRVFNGVDGEFAAQIAELGKKSGRARIAGLLRPQEKKSCETHLLFAPLKKNRMDTLIEKAVELGATDLHPVITDRTEIRKLNEERLRAQIIEAAEQCERMTIPTLYPLSPLADVLRSWPDGLSLYACIERGDHGFLPEVYMPGDSAFFIGPVGGLEESEITALKKRKYVIPVSLGKRVYRSETACIICLAQAMLSQK